MPEQVTLHSRRLLQVLVAPGVFRAQVSVNYSAENMMPRSIFIDQDQDTPEGLRRAIAEDLRKAREGKPEILELP